MARRIEVTHKDKNGKTTFLEHCANCNTELNTDYAKKKCFCCVSCEKEFEEDNRDDDFPIELWDCISVEMDENGSIKSVHEAVNTHCLSKEIVKRTIEGMKFYTAQGCFTIDKEVTKKKLLEELKL